jgi:type IV pilus assembly protein PilE
MAAAPVSVPRKLPTEGPCCRAVSAFTLLEMLVALAVVAVLVALAVASYGNHAIRAQRAEAVRMLLSAAACQERLRSRTGRYDATQCVDDRSGSTYDLRIEPTAENHPADRCGTLTIDQSGHRSIEGEESLTSACWGGR